MRKQIKVKRLEGSPYAIDFDVYGRGASATIVKAYNLDNLKEELVSKVISISEEEASGVYKNELQILKELPPHPNLVNYKKIQISSEKNLYLIMEFCNGGNLDKYMFDCKYAIAEDKIWFFLKQFCDGYRVLYEHSLIHRDIKPENILIHNGDFKIADFGLSKIILDPETTQNLSMKGTPIYMAP
jgi:serine/threonine protein kinase